MLVLIVDALGSERGFRRFTRDVIGAGPRMVAGILEQYNMESRIMTAEQFLGLKSIQMAFDHLLVSAMTMDFPVVKQILQKWNKIGRNGQQKSVRLLGGPITASHSKILLNLDFDIGIFGEAEGSLTDLIQNGILSGNMNFDALESINGLMFKSGLEIIETRFRQYLTKEELNSFKPSTKRIKDYEFYRAARVFVECVRGCSNFLRPKVPLPDGRVCNDCGTCSSSDLTHRIACPLSIPPGCGYCAVPSIYGPPRSRTISNIMTEIKELVELGVTRFNLGASDFMDYQREELVAPRPLTDPRYPPPNYDQIEGLLAELAKIISDTDIHVFIENIKASLFTEHAASLIAQYLPNTTLSIGAETGSKSHLKLLGRSSSSSEVLNAIQIAKKNKLRLHTYFIHGLPGQTLQTAIETRRFMRKLAQEGIDKITVYKFRPLPQSAFEEFPVPPSSSADKASDIIAKTAIEINFEKKKELIGTIEEVTVSEISKKSKSKAIGYPLQGGPTVLIDDGAKFVGQVVRVKINKVLSDKLVGGFIIQED